MEVKKSQSTTLRITDVPALDPITVILADIGPGCGKIIIECYGEAWANYWGSMGERTVAEFFARCDNSYLLSKFGQALHAIPIHNEEDQELVKGKKSYLVRILEAVRHALLNHYEEADDGTDEDQD